MTPRDLAEQARARLARVVELVGPLRPQRRHEVRDAPLREALAVTDSREARSLWSECERLWWELARTDTADVIGAEARQMAVRVGHRYLREDLEQMALLGAFRAAQDWRPEGGASWRSFAGRGVRMHLMNYTREGHAVYASGKERYRARQLSARLAAIEQAGGFPRLSEAAEAVGVSVEYAERVRALDRMLYLDAPGLHGEAHHDLVADPVDPEVQVERQHDIARARAALDRLPDELREVLMRRTGEGQTYDQIGEALGCSREWARRLERKAMRALAALLGAADSNALPPARVRLVDRVQELRARQPHATPSEVAALLGVSVPQARSALDWLRRRA